MPGTFRIQIMTKVSMNRASLQELACTFSSYHTVQLPPSCEQQQKHPLPPKVATFSFKRFALVANRSSELLSLPAPTPVMKYCLVSMFTDSHNLDAAVLPDVELTRCVSLRIPFLCMSLLLFLWKKTPDSNTKEGEIEVEGPCAPLLVLGWKINPLMSSNFTLALSNSNSIFEIARHEGFLSTLASLLKYG